MLSRGQCAALFPTSGATRPGPGAWLLAAGAVGAGTVLALLRVPRALDTTWAEDAYLFLADAVARPWWENILAPYSGYLHVLPRMLAELASLLPPSLAAPVLTVSAALCTCLFALCVYVASGAHLRSIPARLAVSVPMLVLPFAQAEVPLSLATLRWQFMYVMFWALLWTPASRTGRVLLPVLVALAMVSDNVVIIFLPLALLRWWVRRDRLSRVIAAVVGAGTAVNIAIPAFGLDQHPGILPRTDPLWAVAAYIVRPLPQLFFGADGVGDRPGRGAAGMAVTLAAWAVLAFALAIAWWRRSGRWPLALLALGYSATMYVFVVMTSGYALVRYSVPVALLLITTFVALLAPIEPAGPARWVPLGAIAAVMLLACAVNFRIPNERSGGPLWSDGLVSARNACTTGAVHALVRVSPSELGWAADLPCEYLSR